MQTTVQQSNILEKVHTILNILKYEVRLLDDDKVLALQVVLISGLPRSLESWAN